jgi:hypothetical protein
MFYFSSGLCFGMAIVLVAHLYSVTSLLAEFHEKIDHIIKKLATP